LIVNKLVKRVPEEKANGKLILPSEYHDLFKLVQIPSGAVGQQLPGEDFEQHAIPVPSELLETEVKWSQYNFYSFGS
jgi:N-acetylglucosamine-6-sulfatase